MADFEIKLAQLTTASSEFDKIQREINNISQQVGSVMRSVRSSIRANLNFSQTKKTLCSNIDNCATDMSQLSKGIRQAVQYYMGHEKNVAEKTFGKTVKVSTKNTESKDKSILEKLKEGFSNAVIGTTKAIKKTAKKVTSGVKKIAKKAWDGIKTGAEKTWGFVKNTAGTIKDGYVTIFNYLKDTYNNKGWFYDVVQYGKSAVSIAANVATAVVAIASIAGSGGLSTPAAVATIIYSVNGISNSIADIVNVATDNHDKVGGVNFLKTGLSGVGGWIGDKLGNEKIGEIIGTGAYYAGSVYTMVANIKNAIAKTKQIDKVKFKDAYESVKKLGSEKVSVSKIMTTDIGKLKVQSALMKKVPEYKDFFNFVDNMKQYKNVLKDAVEIGVSSGSSLHELINIATDQDTKNPLIEYYNEATKENPVKEAYSGVKGAYENVKDTIENISDLYKAIQLKPAY